MSNISSQFCILCGQSRTSTSRLFRVPKDERKRQSWIDSCGKFLRIGTFVCSKHFLPEFMGIKHLKSGALPLPRTPKYIASRQNTDGTHEMIVDINEDEIIVDNEKFEVKIESIDSYNSSEETEVKRDDEKIYNTIHYEFTSIEDELQGFKCPLCDYVSTVKNLLRTHISSVHHNLDQFKFQSINLSGNYKNARQQYMCQLCDFTSGKKFAFYAHLRSEHPNFKKFQCPFCDYASDIRKVLENHLSYAHCSLKNHECPDCDFSTAHKSSLKLHMNRTKYICELCSYKTCKERTLRLHMDDVHFHDKTRKSHFCEYSTFKPEILETQTTDINSSTTNNRCYVCHLCGYEVTEFPLLEAHTNEIHK